LDGAAIVNVPLVVIVPPDKPLPVATEVTVPEPPEEAIVMLPAPLVTVMPEPAVRVVLVKFVPLPMSKAPLAGVEVRPVPPLATGNVPVTPVVNGRPVPLVSVTEAGVPKALAAVNVLASSNLGMSLRDAATKRSSTLSPEFQATPLVPS
jgi:hypothetical protein